MACRVKLDALTEEQKHKIRQNLLIQPKSTTFTQNRYGASTEKDPIQFYVLDKPNNEIRLPYTFANCLLSKHINSEISFPPGKFNFTGKLRDYQEEPARLALEQLNNFGTSHLALYTAFGKSLTSIYLGWKLLNESHQKVGGIILIVTNRETIQNGWHETILKNTDAQLWIVDSKMKIPSTCNIILSMNGRVEKIPRAILDMVSVLILDEMHLLCTTSNVGTLLSTTPRYCITLSATLERPDNLHLMAYAMVSPLNRVEVKINQDFKEGNLGKMIQAGSSDNKEITSTFKNITVHKISTNIEVETVKNKMGTTDFGKMMAALAEHPLRNAIIIDFIEKNPQHKFMVLTWKKDHVKLLHDVLKSRGNSVDFLAGTKSKYHDSRILLGTISKISTGFDCSTASLNFDGIAIDTCILAGSTKSANLHIQSIGRAFRSKAPTILDIVDKNEILKRHWNERKKNYLELCCTIIESEIRGNVEVLGNLEGIVTGKTPEQPISKKIQTLAIKNKKHTPITPKAEAETSDVSSARLEAIRNKYQK